MPGSAPRRRTCSSSPADRPDGNSSLPDRPRCAPVWRNSPPADRSNSCGRRGESAAPRPGSRRRDPGRRADIPAAGDLPRRRRKYAGPGRWVVPGLLHKGFSRVRVRRPGACRPLVVTLIVTLVIGLRRIFRLRRSRRRFYTDRAVDLFRRTLRHQRVDTAAAAIPLCRARLDFFDRVLRCLEAYDVGSESFRRVSSS